MRRGRECERERDGRVDGLIVEQNRNENQVEHASLKSKLFGRVELKRKNESRFSDEIFWYREAAPQGSLRIL